MSETIIIICDMCGVKKTTKNAFLGGTNSTYPWIKPTVKCLQAFRGDFTFDVCPECVVKGGTVQTFRLIVFDRGMSLEVPS